MLAAPRPPGELTVALSPFTDEGRPHHVAWMAEALGNQVDEPPATPDQIPNAVTGMTRYASASFTLKVNDVTSGPTKARVLYWSLAARYAFER